MLPAHVAAAAKQLARVTGAPGGCAGNMVSLDECQQFAANRTKNNLAKWKGALPANKQALFPRGCLLRRDYDGNFVYNPVAQPPGSATLLAAKNCSGADIYCFCKQPTVAPTMVPPHVAIAAGADPLVHEKANPRGCAADGQMSTEDECKHYAINQTQNTVVNRKQAGWIGVMQLATRVKFPRGCIRRGDYNGNWVYNPAPADKAGVAMEPKKGCNGTITQCYCKFATAATTAAAAATTTAVASTTAATVEATTTEFVGEKFERKDTTVAVTAAPTAATDAATSATEPADTATVAASSADPIKFDGCVPRP